MQLSSNIIREAKHIHIGSIVQTLYRRVVESQPIFPTTHDELEQVHKRETIAHDENIRRTRDCHKALPSRQKTGMDLRNDRTETTHKCCRTNGPTIVTGSIWDNGLATTASTLWSHIRFSPTRGTYQQRQNPAHPGTRILYPDQPSTTHPVSHVKTSSHTTVRKPTTTHIRTHTCDEPNTRSTTHSDQTHIHRANMQMDATRRITPKPTTSQIVRPTTNRTISRDNKIAGATHRHQVNSIAPTTSSSTRGRLTDLARITHTPSEASTPTWRYRRRPDIIFLSIVLNFLAYSTFYRALAWLNH